MPKFYISTLSLAFGLLLFGCNLNSGKESTSSSSSLSEVDQLKIQNELDFNNPETCDEIGINDFCIRGLSSIKFGDTLVFKTLSLEGIGEKDSIMNAYSDSDTVTWNIKTLQYPNGNVILESDFKMFLYLSRIRIETPDLKNLHKIGVGNTLGDLKKHYKNLVVSPYIEEELIEVSIEENYNIYFHFENPGNKLLDLNAEDHLAKDLPDSLKITRIVLWDRTIG